MKKYLLILFLLINTPIFASHTAGATIYYEAISNNEYRLTMVLYRYCGGNPIPVLTTKINAINKCLGGSMPITLNLLPNSGKPMLDPCGVNPNKSICNGGTKFGLEKYEFQGIFTVPAMPNNCFDWHFESDIVCCRNPNNSISNTNIFVNAYLNHSLNPKNSSAKFSNNFNPINCSGNEIELNFQSTDANNDSLVYELIPTQESNIIPSTYFSNTSYLKPIEIAQWSSISLNKNTGILKLTPSPQTLIGVFAVKVSDYRQLVPGVWVLAGWTILDIQHYFEIDPTYCENLRPKFRDALILKSCGDTKINLDFNVEIECKTVQNNASEFRLVSPFGDYVPIKTSTPVNCIFLYPYIASTTKQIELELNYGFRLNGRYILYIKKGSDLNTLKNKCNLYMHEFDSIIIQVSGCNEISTPFDLENVCVNAQNNKTIRIEWSKPTDSNMVHFDKYIVYNRKNPNSNWEILTQILNSNQISFEDSSENPSLDSIHYAVSIRYNTGQILPIKKTIDNYVLKVVDEDSLSITLKWQEYVGWANPIYHLEIYSIAEKSWKTINSYSFSNAEIKILKPQGKGKYFARIFTKNPISNYISYSNWVEFEVLPKEIKAYNLITANGDGINDFFEIDELNDNPNTIVKIYNRWGKLVFESNNYQNNWGNKADEGVYFYLLQSPKGETKNGYLRILK